MSYHQEPDINHGLCSWSYPDGFRCSRPGGISPSTGEPQGTNSGEGSKAKWYCSWHYECLSRNLKDDTRSPEYREWYLNSLKNQAKMISNRPVWDANDEFQVKGLALLGSESLAWKMAPEKMRRAAEAVIAGGWKPKNGSLSATVARVETEIEIKAQPEPEAKPEPVIDLEAEKRRMIDDFNSKIRDGKSAAANDDFIGEECPF